MSESDSFLWPQRKSPGGKEGIALQDLSTTSNVADDSVNNSITEVNDDAEDGDVQRSPQSPSTPDGGDSQCKNYRMLERQLSAMKKENEELKKDYNKLNEEKAALLREHRSKIEKMEQSSAYVAARLDTVEADNRTLKRELSEMKKENDRKDEEIEKLKAELDDAAPDRKRARRQS